MENIINRSLLRKVIKHLDDRQIIAILGPRQAGKTTLFQIIQNYLLAQKGEMAKNIFSFTFEDPEIRSQFNQDPKEFISARLKDTSERAYFFFDEYHWAKEGGQKLKLLFDLYSPEVKFFITGSSSLEITFQTGKFLVGRVYTFYLYPLSFDEYLQTKSKEVLSAYKETSSRLHSLEKSLRKTIFDSEIQKSFAQFCIFGGYPEVATRSSQDSKKLLLKTIVQTYLEKDIRSLLLIEDLESYRKLLQIISAQIGDLLSYNQLSSDTRLSFKLLKKYLNILEETFVVKRIRPFYKNVASELRKNPKLYFIDPGLRNSLLRLYNPLDIHPDKGKLAENFVYSQMRKRNTPINFWRTKGKAEVDFIITQKEGKILPLEVKYQIMNKPRISRSFQSFISSYNPETGIILTNNFWGETKRKKTRILFAPVWYW